MVEITAFRLESKSFNGFFLQINFPPIRALEFITGHVIFKLHYNQIDQLKTTKVKWPKLICMDWLSYYHLSILWGQLAYLTKEKLWQSFLVLWPFLWLLLPQFAGFSSWLLSLHLLNQHIQWSYSYGNYFSKIYIDMTWAKKRIKFRF